MDHPPLHTAEVVPGRWLYITFAGMPSIYEDRRHPGHGASLRARSDRAAAPRPPQPHPPPTPLLGSFLRGGVLRGNSRPATIPAEGCKILSALSAPLSAGISIREFARREGCNDKLVRRAISAGYLKTSPDGTLAPELVGSGWRKANRHADTGADTAADSADMSAPVVRTVRAPVSASAGVLDDREEQPHGGALRRQRRPKETEEDDDDELDLDAFARQVLDGRTPTLATSERAKQAALALKQVLAAQQAANALVELAVAQTVLFKTTRQARDAWMNWPTRIGPLLAADLGLEAAKVVEALTPYVQQQLEALGEPEADFTAPED